MKYPDTLKVELYAQCVIFANKRIANALQALRDAQEAANGEEKSSAGDKYETGRAMAHLEREKAEQQLEEAHKLIAMLNKVSSSIPSDRISLGSVVITNEGNFYIAISAGKISVGEIDFIALSPVSPIGTMLLHKKAGEKILFNKQSFEILEIL